MERNGDRSVGFISRKVLLPDRASVLDLFHLLRTGDITYNRSVDCEEQEAVGIAHRLIIFISIIIQIVLLSLTKPTAWVGATIENWLNLITSTNDGFFSTILSYLLKGKQVFPDHPKSKDYRSFLAFADERVRLDKNIGPEDGRYLPALTMMSSKFAYENPANIENAVRQYWNHMEFLEVLDCSNDYYGRSISSQAFIFSNKRVYPEIIVVAFRGTQLFDMVQWCIDVDFSWYEHEEAGRIHEGFMKALGLQSNGEWPKEVEDTSRFAYYAVREKLRKIVLDRPNAKFVVTGHSLGGAMAVLFPVVLMLHKEEQILERLEAVYTYGQPRVGDEKLGEFVAKRIGNKYARFVYSNDIVPRLPFDDPIFEYKHFGTCCFFDETYTGHILKGLPNRNYFSLSIGFFTMYLTAMSELYRSFVIGNSEGPDYREGWVLRLIRTIGLVMPGIAAHGPQDYVNSTRLGDFLSTKFPSSRSKSKHEYSKSN